MAANILIFILRKRSCDQNLDKKQTNKQKQNNTFPKEFFSEILHKVMEVREPE